MESTTEKIKVAVITGDSSGLGFELATQLQGAGFKVFGISLDENGDGNTWPWEHFKADVGGKSANMVMPAMAIEEAMSQLTESAFIPSCHETDDFHFVLVNCAGINDIDWLENFNDQRWDRVMDTNAKGIFIVTRAFLDILKSTKGTLVNVVSNAAHMPMTCSLAYNASKAAAHIMTLQLARELTKRYGISVFGIAPNRMKGTQMSADIDRMVTATRGWTEEYAHEYQRNGLLTGEETDPAMVAEILTYLLDVKERHHFLSGTVLPMGA